MKVFVTGGSGFIGRALIAALLERRHQVVALSRKPPAGADGLRWVRDLQGLGTQHFEAVINLAGEPLAVRWNERRKAEFRRSRIELTERLVERCHLYPPEVFISASAIGYYGALDRRGVTEKATAGDDFGALLCRDWERAAMQAPGRVVAPRIGIVLHPAGGTLARLLWPFRLGLGGPVGDGRQFLSWIDRGDLVRLILFALDHPVEGPLNATAPNPVTSREFASELGARLGRPAVIPTPALALRLAFGEMADALLLRGPQVFPEKAVSAGFRFQYETLGEALGALDLRPGHAGS